LASVEKDKGAAKLLPVKGLNGLTPVMAPTIAGLLAACDGATCAATAGVTPACGANCGTTWAALTGAAA
jgi:hypothetical protein